MKHLKLYENFDEAPKETPWEELKDEYAELSWKMDKYMPEDGDVMDEYYELLDAGDVEDLIAFLEMNADEEKMMQYMPEGGGMNGFAQYLIDGESVDEAKDPQEITWKDRGRIEDLMKKANGNATKAKQLAERMAKSIKDGYKALRRALAAEDENYHDIAAVFFKRAEELNAA